ncbi:hypothetical protein D9M68_656490 [compost metagenome]
MILKDPDAEWNPAAADLMAFKARISPSVLLDFPTRTASIATSSVFSHFSSLAFSMPPVARSTLRTSDQNLAEQDGETRYPPPPGVKSKCWTTAAVRWSAFAYFAWSSLGMTCSNILARAALLASNSMVKPFGYSNPASARMVR